MPSPSTLTREQWPPDYLKVYDWRLRMLARLRTDDQLLLGALGYYAEHPVSFINHWVDTYDPRNAMDPTAPTRMPMVLFERQEQWVEWFYGLVKDQESGLCDKSRTMGATWLACACSVHLWRFIPGSSIGWGSRKQDLVDQHGVMDSIFEKMRFIIRGLPRIFWPHGFSPDEHMPFLRIINPDSGASITGEAGDNIGRGGRKSVYIKDESAHYEHPESIEAALSENTRVQVDISTHAGVGTVFYRRMEAGREWTPDGEKIPSGTTRVFVLDWRDHPTMTQEWHDKKEKKAKEEGLLHLFRQEVDRDAASSLVGIVIRPEWVNAAIDAHIKLDLPDVGQWCAALDVADEGGDLNAYTRRKGIVLRSADDWGEGDVGESTRRAINMSRGFVPITIQYDCIGIGAGVKAEANRLRNESDPSRRMPNGIHFAPWDAGASVIDPEKRFIPGDSESPLNKDLFLNLKAQAWWNVARRFERTYRAISEGIKFKPDELISLDSRLPKLHQIKRELSQPTIKFTTGSLLMQIDKKPEGARSPNLADSIIMNYFPTRIPLIITAEMLRASEVKTR